MPITAYCERLEDVLLHRVFRHVAAGFYIDVGANHPQVNSVTKLFYDRGWRGINIDPAPTCFAQVARARPRDVNLCLAAGDANGTIAFHEILGTGLSTVVERFARQHEGAGFKRQTYDVAMRTLADICTEHVRGEIHLLNIDVEGAEPAVLRGCDFTRFRPWVVLIESTEPLTEIPSYAPWEPLLLSAGYEFATANAVNRFYLAREHEELRGLFAIPVDDYERASSMEKLAAFEALTTRPAWRLLRRMGPLIRPLVTAVDRAAERVRNMR